MGSSSLGLVGRKVGMTRIFAEDGKSVPVTVLDVSNNRITQIKKPDTDGYVAVQVAFGTRRDSRVNKPLSGHMANAGCKAGLLMREFRLLESDLEDLKVGEAVDVNIFNPGQKVDVTGESIGKGFAGGVKRHNFKTQRTTHGNSLSHRAPGSIGMAQDPGRVFPGKRMPGHMGAARTTVQNLSIVRVDEARQLLLLQGAVPGAKGGNVIVRPAVKAG